jgi:hypothetical protein
LNGGAEVSVSYSAGPVLCKADRHSLSITYHRSKQRNSKSLGEGIISLAERFLFLAEKIFFHSKKLIFLGEKLSSEHCEWVQPAQEIEDICRRFLLILPGAAKLSRGDLASCLASTRLMALCGTLLLVTDIHP